MGKKKTDMPEFPPVTMYTLPVRSGKESGWKVIVEIRYWWKRRMKMKRCRGQRNQYFATDVLGVEKS